MVMRWPTSQVRLDRLLLSRSYATSSLTRISRNEVVERGSLWHWLSNKHQYDHLEEDIDRALWDWVPDICRVLDVPKHPEGPRLAVRWTPDDAWVAGDPETRAKLLWVTVAITAPVSMRTHLFKHKLGFVENEVSRRYVTGPPKFFVPHIWRRRAPGVKQGSLPEPVARHWAADLLARSVYKLAGLGYRGMLALGVCPEQARFLLPEGRLTEWYWTGDLQSINRAVNLRTRDSSQEETWELMQKVKALSFEEWPTTCEKMRWSS